MELKIKIYLLFVLILNNEAIIVNNLHTLIIITDEIKYIPEEKKKIDIAISIVLFSIVVCILYFSCHHVWNINTFYYGKENYRYNSIP